MVKLCWLSPQPSRFTVKWESKFVPVINWKCLCLGSKHERRLKTVDLSFGRAVPAEPWYWEGKWCGIQVILTFCSPVFGVCLWKVHEGMQMLREC